MASFDSTGAEQTFTVPAGVSSVHVAAVGGRGGSSTGGLGAQVSGDLSVSPGQVVFVEVAGNGSAPLGGFSAGGFNGGGDSAYLGGAGGGASDLRTASRSQGGSLSSRLIVAAGGGGGNGQGSTYGGDGGAAGAPGTEGKGEQHGYGGGAGTASSGGAAGAPNGVAGMLGAGGAGGGNGTSAMGGSGGGGGYYGGGGGGTGLAEGRGGGGGGGSSFTGSAIDASVGADTTGVPSIVISYTSGSTGGGAGSGAGGGTGGGAGGGTGGGAGGGNAPTTIAVASKEQISPSSFRAASSGPSATASKYNKKAHKLGTKVTYTLSIAASVRFTVQQTFPGRRTGKGTKGRCVAQTKNNRTAPRCRRVLTLKGSFTQAGNAGTNSFRFTGRINGKKLNPGTYTLLATPTANGKSAQSTSATFRVIN